MKRFAKLAFLILICALLLFPATTTSKYKKTVTASRTYHVTNTYVRYYSYKGSADTFTVNDAGYYAFYLEGGQGGKGRKPTAGENPGNGGAPGSAKGYAWFEKGDVITIAVARGGKNEGKSGDGSAYYGGGLVNDAGMGGGASFIDRTRGGTTLKVAVAGGGGGGASGGRLWGRSGSDGGAGGAISGTPGIGRGADGGSRSGAAGGAGGYDGTSGGTGSNGGTNGTYMQGGKGAGSSDSKGGGGGSGYYGGGGGGVGTGDGADKNTGGGGGSSYLATGIVATGNVPTAYAGLLDAIITQNASTRTQSGYGNRGYVAIVYMGQVLPGTII